MSLSQTLKDHIRFKGTVNLTELHQIAEEQNHKQSNCERQLRLLAEKDFIEPIKNDKGCITGYKWIGKAEVIFNESIMDKDWLKELEKIKIRDKQQTLI